MFAGAAVPKPAKIAPATLRTRLRAPSRPTTISDSSALTCEFVAPEALPASIAAQWSVLADQAAEPNCFAERWFLQPSLALLAETADIKIALVTSQSGLLIGLMPLTVKPSYGRIPIATVQNWIHHNAFLGVPLMRRGMEVRFWKTVLKALDGESWATPLFHINGLTENGRVMRGLKEATEKLNRPCDIVHRTRRALLKSNLSPQDYWDANVRKKKRKEIDRLANRLSEAGELRYATLSDDDDVAAWVDDFLTLEKKGWKGEAGSALGCDPALTTFLHTIASGAQAAGKLDFHRIDLDGKPIAMLINFITAPGGFSYKIAFDEDYYRYSPGVLIERYNLRILDRPNMDWVDSCAAENHSMIDSLWAERRDLVRVTLPRNGFWPRQIFRICRAAEQSVAWLRDLKRNGKDISND